MTLEFLDLYNECAGQPWSMFDNDAESLEDLESALKISINKAASFLWNYQPWSFRYKTHLIRTRANKQDYAMPDGNIVRVASGSKVSYGVKCDGKRLEYESNFEELEDKTGKPEYFYVIGEKIYLYPTPDDIYNVSIDYLAIPYALNSDEEYVYELSEEGDHIDIPEKYEKLFKNCIISLAMMYAIADENDENYSGYKKQYEDSLGILFKYCKNTLLNRKITW